MKDEAGQAPGRKRGARAECRLEVKEVEVADAKMLRGEDLPGHVEARAVLILQIVAVEKRAADEEALVGLLDELRRESADAAGQWDGRRARSEIGVGLVQHAGENLA